ncbi:MAG: protein TolA, partial [Clostridiales bacterium]|nr:protein TolA [Clostridiales bacterium]
ARREAEAAEQAEQARREAEAAEQAEQARREAEAAEQAEQAVPKPVVKPPMVLALEQRAMSMPEGSPERQRLEQMIASLMSKG